jgi:hypothetical protein
MACEFNRELSAFGARSARRASDLSDPSSHATMSMSNGYEVPQPTPFHQLSLLLEKQPETFASGNREIQDAALQSTEHIFNLGTQAPLHGEIKP